MELRQWIRSTLVFEEGICVLLFLVRRRVPRLQLDVLPRYIITLVCPSWAQPGPDLLPNGFYFFESGRGSIRPFEVFGAPEEAIEGQSLFSQTGDEAT